MVRGRNEERNNFRKVKIKIEEEGRAGGRKGR
jgi:hypothetical protein